MQRILKKIEEAIAERKPTVLCTIVDSTGSTPRKAGSRMLVYADGSIFGTVGGGAVEMEVKKRALELIGTNQPLKISCQLETDLSMHCGGTMEIFLEPVNPFQKLFIFGAGHIGKALAGFANTLDFQVTLFDPRPEIMNDPVMKQFQCFNKDYFQGIEEAHFDSNTYIVIVTPKHILDEEILSIVAKKPHAYLGMIGSRNKVALLRERFLKEGLLSAEALDAIDMPIGIRFAAETPEEIAISILAKLIDVRNTQGVK